MVCGTRHKPISSKLRHSFVLQTYYFAILIGITSLHFNFKTKKFCNSKYLYLYAAIVNLIFIFVAPTMQWHIIDDVRFYVDNLQMKLINSINLNLRCVAAIMTLVLRWKRECHVRKIVERLIVLEEEYFDRVTYPSELIQRFDRLFFLKYASVWLQSLSIMYIVYRYVASTSGWWYLTFFYVVIILNILHGVVMHYYMCLLYIGSRFYIINYRLEEIYMTIARIKSWKSQRSQQQMQKALAAELDCITYIHCNLMNIVSELNDSYMFQILTVLMTHIFNNTAMGYYGLMMCIDFMKFNLSYYDLIIGGFSYCCLVLDLYLVDINCNTVQTSYNTTGSIVKQFTEFHNMEESLRKSCELLSLHLVQRKLFINICGMFNLNKHTSFVMFGFTIRQVLILVQNDVAISIRYLRDSRSVGQILQTEFSKAFNTINGGKEE
ncbi:putative gustatory receptor 58a [Lucilia cuprina]|uniref:putative gustatory receptor 58a n=1 Tax=Lucilia cuprina TaxID=7375 RepID=UPI001F051879|nr:putative gustatory receptor 58a [Lucilia cuprina]